MPVAMDTPRTVQPSAARSSPEAVRQSSTSPKSATGSSEDNHMDSSNVIDVENYLLSTLNLSNKLSKHDKIDSQEIALAKMLNYCIRMLHADGWHPPTVVRAMAMKEAGLGQSMKGTLYQAMRDRRNEMDVNKTIKKGDAHKIFVKDDEKSRVASDISNASDHVNLEKTSSIENVVKRKTSQVPGQGPQTQKRRAANKRSRKTSGRKSTGSDGSRGSPAQADMPATKIVVNQSGKTAADGPSSAE